MIETLESSWREQLRGELTQPYFSELSAFVEHAYATHTIYPPREKLFNAFARTPYDRVRVVIIGQDPYHEPGQAQGLAFYVPDGVRPPPSLRNIAKELKTEYPETYSDGRMPDLINWSDQGVLLINSTLTVESGKAGSHQKHGWETFTDRIIELLSKDREHLVFILWGAYAQKKGAIIDRNRHLVLESAHPSPLSARHGFFGCNHFRRCNEYLDNNGIMPIYW